MTRGNGIASIRHKQAKIRGRFREIRSTSGYWNSEDITVVNSSTSHGINIHQIRESGEIPSSNGRQRINGANHIREVNRGERVIRTVEAGTRKRHNEVLSDVKDGRVVDGISLPELVGGDEAAVDGVCDGGEGVGGARLVVSGDGFPNAVDAGAGDGDFEEEARGEDVVLDVGVGDVDGVGGEKRDGVDLEERRYLRDFEVGVERVAEKRVA